MQCECCLELCCADEMAELPCHHIAHKACIAVLLADPLYANRPCPVKEYCDGGRLLKPGETEDVAIKRLRYDLAYLHSQSKHIPAQHDVQTVAANQVYDQLCNQLQSDEYIISRKDGKLRYLKYSKSYESRFNCVVTTVTVYVDRAAQYTLRFKYPYRRVIPFAYDHGCYTDFVITNKYNLALVVEDGVIDAMLGNIPDKIDISVVDHDDNLKIKIRGNHWGTISPLLGYYPSTVNSICKRVEQELVDHHYSQWLENHGHEIKNLESCIDILKTRKVLIKKGLGNKLPPI